MGGCRGSVEACPDREGSQFGNGSGDIRGNQSTVGEQANEETTAACVGGDVQEIIPDHYLAASKEQINGSRFLQLAQHLLPLVER